MNLKAKDFRETEEISPSSVHESEFIELLNQLVLLSRSFGIDLKATTSSGLQKFQGHSEDIQKVILDNCRKYIHFCSAAANDEKIHLRDDNTTLTWFALRQLKLRPTSDLFSYLTNEHIVEIYNNHSIQIYRSFNLFKYLSYSLSDIFTHEWWELYKRSDDVFTEMFGMASDLLCGSYKTVIKTTFSDHWVEEIFSPQKNRATMKHDFFAPLYDESGKISHFMSVFKIIDFKSTI